MSRIYSLLILLFIPFLSARAIDPAVSSRQMAESLMHKPSLEFDTLAVTSASFPEWRAEMQAAMGKLMKHPGREWKAPVLLEKIPRDGYTVERWESYPLEGAPVRFLALVPDGAKDKKVPAFLCIPGFGQTKELLAGEHSGDYDLKKGRVEEPGKNAMAYKYMREGWIAVAVDNPSFGELSDNGHSDYIETSRFLLESGWSYLGLTSWQDKVVLDWLKTRPDVMTDRIVVSGFSLGTEPLMALGLLDDSIFAFVYNDFLCRTRERALTMNKPQEDGSRPFPNSIEHLIPGFLSEFDFPDIVCALAPRPVICTEGGMDRDFRIIGKAFEIAGAPENFEFHHYKKFIDPKDRVWLEKMPEGIDRAEFFRLANVDPPSHYFKAEHVIPWLHRLFEK